VRIIAGALKGRKLRPPDWPGLRPTSDRLRETLFNVLGARIAEAQFMDAGAGTGAVGIEALSRGAAHVTFVERDPRACRLIEANLRTCGVTDGYTMVRTAFGGAVPRAGRREFDIIFLDPPYEEPALDAWVTSAIERLAPGGLVVLEHAARRDAPEPGGRPPDRRLRSGDSALAFYAGRDGMAGQG
jgi:16S rRNA (guanine(966)-N(2))-methyltransferase RsmD